MPLKRIRKSDVPAWLGALAETSTVYAPSSRGQWEVVLAPLDPDRLTLDFGRLAEPPKRILFPQTEPLLRWEGDRAEPVTDATERILFGLRACDAAAIAILDAFFERDEPDPNYLARRRGARLIVLACRESQESCFCASAGTGPVLSEGFDLQMVEDGEDYLVQVGSEAGEAMLAAAGDRVGDAPAGAESRWQAAADRAAAGQPALDLAAAADAIRRGTEADGFWESVAGRCLLCGGCAYVCPTCTCFTVYDWPDPEAARDASTGRRIRAWDSCILEGFTREAGGHNPLPDRAARCRRRYEHKLTGSEHPAYAFRCVGCGRCTETCLSRLGMTRIVRDLAGEPGKEGET